MESKKDICCKGESSKENQHWRPKGAAEWGGVEIERRGHKANGGEKKKAKLH